MNNKLQNHCTLPSSRYVCENDFAHYTPLSLCENVSVYYSSESSLWKHLRAWRHEESTYKMQSVTVWLSQNWLNMLLNIIVMNNGSSNPNHFWDVFLSCEFSSYISERESMWGHQGHCMALFHVIVKCDYCWLCYIYAQIPPPIV